MKSEFDYLIHDVGGPGLVPPLEKQPVDSEPLFKADARKKIAAGANTAQVLFDWGDDDILDNIDDADVEIARGIFEEGREPTDYEVTMPGVVVHLEALLQQYDKDLLADAASIRTYVVNKLLEESDNKNPQVRLKALKMLGEVTEVSLFTHRVEQTINNKSEMELVDLIRQKLSKLTSKPVIDPQVKDAEVVEAPRTLTADDVLRNMRARENGDG